MADLIDTPNDELEAMDDDAEIIQYHARCCGKLCENTPNDKDYCPKAYGNWYKSLDMDVTRAGLKNHYKLSPYHKMTEDEAELQSTIDDITAVVWSGKDWKAWVMEERRKKRQRAQDARKKEKEAKRAQEEKEDQPRDKSRSRDRSRPSASDWRAARTLPAIGHDMPIGSRPGSVAFPLRPTPPSHPPGDGQMGRYHPDADISSLAKVQLRTACEHMSRAESCCDSAIQVAQAACTAFQNERNIVADARKNVEHILRNLDGR